MGPITKLKGIAIPTKPQVAKQTAKFKCSNQTWTKIFHQANWSDMSTQRCPGNPAEFKQGQVKSKCNKHQLGIKTSRKTQKIILHQYTGYDSTTCRSPTSPTATIHTKVKLLGHHVQQLRQVARAPEHSATLPWQRHQTNPTQDKNISPSANPNSQSQQRQAATHKSRIPGDTANLDQRQHGNWAWSICKIQSTTKFDKHKSSKGNKAKIQANKQRIEQLWSSNSVKVVARIVRASKCPKLQVGKQSSNLKAQDKARQRSKPRIFRVIPEEPPWRQVQIWPTTVRKSSCEAANPSQFQKDKPRKTEKQSQTLNMQTQPNCGQQLWWFWRSVRGKYQRCFELTKRTNKRKRWIKCRQVYERVGKQWDKRCKQMWHRRSARCQAKVAQITGNLVLQKWKLSTKGRKSSWSMWQLRKLPLVRWQKTQYAPRIEVKQSQKWEKIVQTTDFRNAAE